MPEPTRREKRARELDDVAVQGYKLLDTIVASVYESGFVDGYLQRQDDLDEDKLVRTEGGLEDIPDTVMLRRFTPEESAAFDDGDTIAERRDAIVKEQLKVRVALEEESYRGTVQVHTHRHWYQDGPFVHRHEMLLGDDFRQHSHPGTDDRCEPISGDHLFRCACGDEFLETCTC